MIVYTDNDPFCCNVLRARIADGGLPPSDVLEKDIREVTADDLAGYEQVHLFAGIGGFGLACKLAGWEGSLLTGGFPCQDISFAGSGLALNGERSGLWTEMFRLIRSVRPNFVVVENVAALLVRGLCDILRDLADIGYDAEWSTVSACSVGATHMRQRLFIVAYPNSINGWPRLRNTTAQQNGAIQAINRFESARASWQARMANPSELYRGADGIPNCMERNRGLGNAIVPQVAAEILKAILQADRGLKP